MRIAVVTISDRASRGQYEDLSGPAIEAWLRETVVTPFEIVRRIVPDGIEPVRDVLVALCDEEHADLILTTGGTGPAPRDETPEAMREVVTRELPGFGEQLRRASLEQTPTAILSRQMAGIRGRTLIINLPGKPSSIRFSLNAVFAAVPYCLDLIGADWMDTDPARVKVFWPAPSSSG
ncbi:molybdopterin adenylyltransferase [Shinella sp. PSBB067]|uniref:molybdopterin adenylyltransferase n=1 Tax=Shinella sp. PSBB067 TaxID=2715959 RepID=UPI00193C5E09|nr:molybdopterin adenylyltransferase [Shinella sp. PSBB067]QRI63977.1 molybdopterin adenylyltransferase [Shinella sp. PSBB067]